MKLFRCKIFCLIASSFLFSCGTDELSGEINISDLTPSIGVPIGSVSYTLESLIKDLTDTTEVGLDPNTEIITITYSDTLDSFGELDDFIDFDQSIDGQDNTVAPVTFGSDSIVTIPIVDTLNYSFELEQEEIIKEISYQTGGTSRLVIIPSVLEDISANNLTLTFSNLLHKDDGSPLVVTFQETLTNVATVETVLIGDYRSVFELDSNNNPLSDIIVNMDASSPEGETINEGERILTLSVTYADIEYESVLGYFGQKSVAIAEQSIDFSFFEEINPGAIIFTSPQASIAAETNIGIPLGFDFRGTKGVRGVDTVFLTPNNESDTLVTAEAPAAIGEVSTVAVSLSPSTGGGYNLDEVFNAAPTEFITSMAVTTNPEADTTNPPLTNFLTNDGFAKPFVDIRLPFRVIIDSLSIFLNRSLDINEDFEELTSAQLRIKTTNSVPLIGVVFMDVLQGSTLLSSISLGDTVIAVPQFSASFDVTEPSRKETLIDLSREDLDNLKTGDNFTIRIVADTKIISETRAVDINRDASLTFNVSLIANTSIDL